MNGYSRGLELFLELKKKENSVCSGWLSVSWLKSERILTERAGLDSPVPVNEKFYPGQDRRYALSLVFDLKLSAKWFFSAQFDYIAGAPYTPILGEEVTYSQGYMRKTIYGPYNSERLPDFHKLDVKLDYRTVVLGLDASIFLQVDNVYNHKNVMEYDYNYDYTEKKPRTFLGIIPLLGVEFSW